MKKITRYQNQKILVLGLAKSGVSAAKLLHELGALVTVNDSKEFEENPEAQDLLQLGIKVVTGGHPVELLDEDFVLIVKNPGIPYTNPILEKAIIKEIPIITEVELAYQISEAPFIGITGTNGKTTTTTMIGLLLNQNRPKGVARLAGNIGFPANQVAQEATKEDVLVTELSSFQLLGIETFHPEIAVITNLYEAHLDYHGTRKEYVAAKWNLQNNMTETDKIVLNFNQSELRELALHTKAQVIPFSTKVEVLTGAYVKEEKIYYQEQEIMSIADLGIPGEHNVENALAAIVVAKLNGVSNQDIQSVLSNFTGVTHRLQFVAEIEGRKFYNDSKATNILATEKALSGFNNQKTILLAGGLDRGNSFDELIPAIKDLKAIVLFGEAKNKLAEAAREAGITEIILTENVETAVPLAYQVSQSMDAILLSPACASWDQYLNFEVRGEKYMASVQNLKK